MKNSSLSHTNGAACIPNNSVDLKLGVLYIRLTWSAVHCGVDPTWHALCKTFISSDERDDVCRSVSARFLCLLANSGESTFFYFYNSTCMNTNETTHFDFLFLGQSGDNNKYALIMKDDISGYLWLDSSLVADAEHAAALSAYCDHLFTA